MSETQELFAYKTTVTDIAMQIEAAEQEVDEAKAVLKEKREALKKLNAQLSNVLEELIDKAQEVGDDSITELEQLQTVIDRKQCFTSEQKRRVYAIKDRLDAIEL